MSQDHQAVLNVVEKMTSDFQDNNIEAVMTAYEAEATVLFEPGQPVSDRATLIEMFHGMAALRPEFTYSGHEVIVNGDIAVHFAPWQMTGQMPDGTAIEQDGLSVAILRKQADGSWRMVIDNPHGSRLLAGAE